MSLHPKPWFEPSEQIVWMIREIPARQPTPMPVAVRDELGDLFADDQFAAVFAQVGPQGWCAGRLLLATVLQAAGGFTDRQAASAVRDNLAWMYALGLSIGNAGFDASVLSAFRTRLINHEPQRRALDLMVARLAEKGLLKAGGKQRTDSTQVLATVRYLNQIELVGDSVRACLEALQAADLRWVQVVLGASWQLSYGIEEFASHMPSAKTRRVALGNAYARDGQALLRAARDPASPEWVRELPAVELLRQVLVQTTKTTTDRTGQDVVTLRDVAQDGIGPGWPPVQ